MARKTTTVYGRRKSLFQRMAALTVTASLVLSTFAGAAVLAAAGIVIIVIRKRKRVCTK